ncbi:MAG: hypothetical protein A6F71_09080 [Cycloclasticus sp. symbiont of Poecilosclerida sp. M]|nr:MAG: hypothetical protein A6F71_09080 [Cycloclasticus sp. symbiont of Poecilosclerida sp. M]
MKYLQPLTAGDLNNPSSESLNNSYMFMKNIRGTAAYWKDQLLDLLARINTLGPPTFFVTLTANDMHWPELFMLIDPTLTAEQVAQMSSGDKLKLEISRHILCKQSCSLSADYRLIPKECHYGQGQTTGYCWMRIEFQMRGSPHVHSGAPKVDTVEGRQQAPQFVDQYISTMLPDPTADPDLHRLVSTLQVHRHSHTCYKHNRVTCRFNYPRPPNPATRLRTRLRTNTDPGSAAQFYVTQRNECDQWVNAYNPTCLLKAWQANMDIQMVGSEYGAAMYVCMYVSKSEPDRLKHALHDTLQNIPPNASQRKRLSMIGATVLTQTGQCTRGYIPPRWIPTDQIYTYCNFSEQQISTKKQEQILKPRDEVLILPDISTQVFQPGTIEYYQDRPDVTEWDNMTLAIFATHYTVTGKDGTSRNSHPKLKSYEKWIKKRQKPACLRVPYLTAASGDKYYYSLLVLFRPFHNESTDLLLQGETARDAFIRKTDDLDMNSSTFLNMAQQIQDAIVRIRFHYPT